MGEVFRTKCTKCGNVGVHQNKNLEQVRVLVCPTCRIRLTVIGHEQDEDASKRTASNFETTHELKDSEKTAMSRRARSIYEAAFGTKEVSNG